MLLLFFIKILRILMQSQIPFKKKYTVQERKEKSSKQMSSNPGKIVIIVEKVSKSNLPSIPNPRYIRLANLDFYVKSNINSQ